MKRTSLRLSGLLVFVPVLFAGAGCTSTPGASPFGAMQQSHRLIDSAKELRAAATEPAPLPRELDKSLLPPYVVEPGDTLLVAPADLDSLVRLPGDQAVLQDGTIDLGTYGRPIVAGKTLPVIEAEIKTLIEAKTKDAGPIFVRLVSRVSKVYYVLGAVNSPGSFQLSGRETVLDGIIAAGGLSTQGSRENIILNRPTAPDGCRIVLPICYREIVQIGDTSTNYQLLPGDRIYVPSKSCTEDLFHKTRECLPCGKPQVPCPQGTGSAGFGCTVAPAAVHAPAHATTISAAHAAKAPPYVSTAVPVHRPEEAANAGTTP